MSQRAEIAVVGSGPGGAVTACTLAEAGRDVLLIEEGPRLEQTSCAPFSVEEMVQKYRNGGVTAALGPCPIAYVEAAVVGGGSEVNSALYLRAGAERLEAWSRAYRVEALSRKDLEPHHQALEGQLQVAWDSSREHPAGLALAKGAERLGLPCQEAGRLARPPAAHPANRQSMSRTLIPRALAAGARLLEATRVQRLRRDSGRWLLQAQGRDGPCEVSAERVFLACGAIQTPVLLRGSGLGPLAGRSLALHPMAKVVAEFPEEVNAPGLGVAAQQVKPTSGRVSYGCSISSPSNLALSLLDHPEVVRRLARDWRRLAVYYVTVPGSGQGAVRGLPYGPEPLVSYRVSAEDMGDMGRGLQELGRILAASGARQVYGPGDRFDESSARLMTIHLMGSCPMGEDRRLCVADSFGRVHGCEGLHLADASLLCGPLGVNPQGTIMALARRNAMRFLEAA